MIYYHSYVKERNTYVYTTQYTHTQTHLAEHTGIKTLLVPGRVTGWLVPSSGDIIFTFYALRTWIVCSKHCWNKIVWERTGFLRAGSGLKSMWQRVFTDNPPRYANWPLEGLVLRWSLVGGKMFCRQQADTLTFQSRTRMPYVLGRILVMWLYW